MHPPPDPRDNRFFSSIVLRIERERKGRYVAAARAEGLTLAAWITAKLDSHLPPPHARETQNPQP